jgi:hypothetical protein
MKTEEAKKEAAKVDNPLHCEKCGKVFKRMGWKERHTCK